MELLPGVTKIGDWSEIKLQIVREYAVAFSTVLAKHPYLKHDYIDAFAGAGVHLSKTRGELVAGSPLNALFVQPPFDELYLVDLDGRKTETLRELTRDYKNVHVLEGDCNEILLTKVFPKVRYEDYRRALCLLDPYGLHLNWTVISEAAKMKSVEVFLNFPIMDMNRNSLLKNYELVDSRDNDRMTGFWGDESWKNASYVESQQASLFGETPFEKQPSKQIAEAFRRRLNNVAGFKFVPEPIPMRNNQGAIVYYLFFASQNETGNRIATHIFDRYRLGKERK